MKKTFMWALRSKEGVLYVGRKDGRWPTQQHINALRRSGAQLEDGDNFIRIAVYH